MRTPGLKGIGEDEEFDEDEWEYYYEDDEEEELNRWAKLFIIIVGVLNLYISSCRYVR